MSHPCVGEYAFGYITSTMVLQVLVHAYLHAVDGFDQQMVIFWHFIMDIFLTNMLSKAFSTFFLVIQKHASEDSFHYILCSCSLVFKVIINNWKLSITCIVRWLFHNCHSFHTMIVQSLSPTSQPGAETQFLGVAVTHINFDICHSI